MAAEENNNEFVKQAKDVFHYANAAAQANLEGFTLNRFACDVWTAFVKRYYHLTEADVHQINKDVMNRSIDVNGITGKPRSFFETIQLIFMEKESRHLVIDRSDNKQKIISDATLKTDPDRYINKKSDYPPAPLKKNIEHLHASGRQFNPLYLVSTTLTVFATGMGIVIDKLLSSKESLDASLGAKVVKYGVVSPLVAVSRTIESLGNLTSFMVESSIKWLMPGKTNKKEVSSQGQVQTVQAEEEVQANPKPISGSHLNIYNSLSISSAQVIAGVKAKQEAQSQALSSSAPTPGVSTRTPLLATSNNQRSEEEDRQNTPRSSC